MAKGGAQQNGDCLKSCNCHKNVPTRYRDLVLSVHSNNCIVPLYHGLYRPLSFGGIKGNQLAPRQSRGGARPDLCCLLVILENSFQSFSSNILENSLQASARGKPEKSSKRFGLAKTSLSSGMPFFVLVQCWDGFKVLTLVIPTFKIK